jgi:hypothetical protein
MLTRGLIEAMNDLQLEGKRGTLRRGSFLIGSTFIVFYAVLLIIQSLSLILQIGRRNEGTLLAVIFAVIYFGWTGLRVYRLERPWFVICLLVVLISGILAGLVAVYYFDLSWDGRDYQQLAVYKLTNGWNPVYTALQPDDIYKNAWLNHYPKGSWLAASSLAMIFKDIEIGKIFNLFLILAVFFIALSFFLTISQFSKGKAVLLSFFLAVNPVSVSQSLSYYTDGQVSSMLILLILLMLLCLKNSDLGCLITLAAAVIIGLNIKFTGTAYIALLLVLFSIVGWYLMRGMRSLLPQWAAILVGIFIGVLVVGYNPYVTNTLHYKQPFYPIYGSNTLNKEFILRNQMPPDFEDMSWMGKLFHSVFSPSQNIIGKEAGSLKFPLSVERSEIIAFARPDVRISGWGPLFGALVILSMVSLAILAFVSRKVASSAGILVGMVFASSLLNSEAWWARYTPQLWLIPVIMLGALWFVKDKRTMILGNVLALLMFANIFLVSGAYFGWNTLKSRELRVTLANLQQSGEKVMLYYGPLEAVGWQMVKYGIPYQRVEQREDLPCPIELEVNVFYSPMDCLTAPP